MAVASIQLSDNLELAKFCVKCRYKAITNVDLLTKVGKIIDHDQRIVCKVCATSFNYKSNSAFFNLKTPNSEVVFALKLIAKGMGLRPTADVTEKSFNSIYRWLYRAGRQGSYIMELFVQGIGSQMVQLDEMWTFVCKNPRKRRNKNGANPGSEGWIWIALDTKTRLIITSYVGRRTKEDARIFLEKVKSCLSPGRIFYTSDLQIN